MTTNMSPPGPSSQNTRKWSIYIPEPDIDVIPVPVLSISASQSLSGSSAPQEPISTGVVRLDRALAASPPGGLVRGQVTEVYGPPGVGKTSLACVLLMQYIEYSIDTCARLNLASNALRNGGKVIWIGTTPSISTTAPTHQAPDTSSPLPRSRLQCMTKEADTQNLIYFRTPTLPHLISLLAHPPTNFPPQETSLLIIDSVSSLFPSYFPNAVELKDRLEQGKLKDKAQLQWLLNRKWNVTSDLGTYLARLAARGIAVLAINQTHTRIKGQPRATLYPLLAGGGWENNVQTRVAMYRDLPDLRVAEVTKRGGRIMVVRLPELVVPFRIGAVCVSSCLSRQDADRSRLVSVIITSQSLQSPAPRRRKPQLLNQHQKPRLNRRQLASARPRMRSPIARTKIQTKNSTGTRAYSRRNKLHVRRILQQAFIPIKSYYIRSYRVLVSSTPKNTLLSTTRTPSGGATCLASVSQTCWSV